jgi:hypothetical protein
VLEIAKNRNKKQEKKGLIPSYCEIPGCGYTNFVTRHRIRPGKSGGKYIPGNVIGLCPNHHVEAEKALITKEVLLAIVYKRYQDGWGKD